MKLGYDFYKSLLLINKNLTKEIFIERTGAKDGYSLNMFSRMYDSITSELINVDKEYEKYYSFEYESMEHFLYRKYNLKGKYIVELMEASKNNPNCLLYRKDDNSYGDYGIAQFTFSDTMYDRVMDIIMLKN
ncbi:hypothetical protein SAMN05421823_104500 [Catalinimonas alkaloidigena]|uniref:Uncharacterized protein n=1 Tax=Catalinimonas alkaloidigena TaxID=1075417 RepID=A0A1G9HQ43_9BACT|nr:hypothetical protein [Catalinimonas alkaloidigena]SDL14955.1 hypothetical protein SAMN05421823_104500 [Catalinimonas alkaloidigena]